MHSETIKAIKRDRPLSEIHALWQSGLNEFMKTRSKYLMY
jgi:uncharacterized protein YbbC (DUF1343 family)